MVEMPVVLLFVALITDDPEKVFWNSLGVLVPLNIYFISQSMSNNNWFAIALHMDFFGVFYTLEIVPDLILIEWNVSDLIKQRTI